MLKSFNRFANLSKTDNVILLSLMRQYHWNNMQNEQQGNNRKQNDQEFFDNIRSNVNDFRKWINIVPPPKKPGHHFSVLNYNILSQQLLDEHKYLYRSHSNQALLWNLRIYNLVGEIIYNNPDILCCQVSILKSQNLSMAFTIFSALEISGSAKVSFDRHRSKIEIIEL